MMLLNVHCTLPRREIIQSLEDFGGICWKYQYWIKKRYWYKGKSITCLTSGFDVVLFFSCVATFPYFLLCVKSDM